MEQPVSKHMSTLGVSAELYLVNRQKIAAHAIWHRLDRAHPILRPRRHDAFLASDEGHDTRPLLGNDPLVHLPRQQAERQADHPGPVAQHPFNSEMGLARVRRAENSRDLPLRRHHRLSRLERLSLKHDFQRVDVFLRRLIRWINVEHLAQHLKRLLLFVHIKQDDAKSLQGTEMLRVICQHVP